MMCFKIQHNYFYSVMSLCSSGRSNVQTNPRNHKVNAHVPLRINYHHAVPIQHLKQQLMEILDNDQFETHLLYFTMRLL